MTMIKVMNYISGDGEINLLLYGDIDAWGVNAKDVVSTLSELERNYSKINLRINSCGGSVFEGLAIYNAIRASRADITIYVDGIAASMASVIALCGRPVYMSKYAQLMIHCVSGGAYGNTKEIESILAEMKVLEATIVKMYAEKTGMSEEEITSTYMDGADHWISAEEALELGFIDGIYDTDEDVQDTMDTTDNVYNYFQAKLLTLKNTKTMIEKIKKSIPQFANCATEESVIAKIAELVQEAGEAAKLREELQQRIAAEMEAKIGNILSAAVDSHKITQEMAENLKKAYADNAEGLQQLVDAMPAKEKVVITPGINASDSICAKSWDELDKSGELALLKAQYPDVYKAKFEQKFGKK